MKKVLEPSIEILIRNFETKEYRWLKITSNTAYYNNEGQNTSHLKVNGNEFIKILQHHLQSITAFSKLNYNKSDLCLVKYTFNNEQFEFNFDYNEKDLLNMANILYKDFKYLIDFHYLNYDDVEYSICKDMKNLPAKTKFVLNDYFKNYGIIAESDKEFLTKHIFDDRQVGKLVKIKKKLCKPLYFCEGTKTFEGEWILWHKKK